MAKKPSQSAKNNKTSTSGEQGLVIAAHGRHYLIQIGTEKLHCVTRGKKSDVAVGDLVEIQRTSNNQGVIEAIVPRRTLLYRSDQYKSKMLADTLEISVMLRDLLTKGYPTGITLLKIALPAVVVITSPLCNSLIGSAKLIFPIK